MYTGDAAPVPLPAARHRRLPRAPPLDHFGLEVPTLDELVAILDRAKAYQARDDRVTIIDLDETVTHGTTSDFTLTNAYLGFLIPLMIELQHITERPTG